MTTDPSSDVLERLAVIRSEVDAFNPDARMAARSLFEAQEKAWKLLPELRATIERLSAELERVLPKNVCLTNANVPDSTIVPLDFTMGELRRIRAALSNTAENG